jgi:hypothetical protein
MSMIMLKGMITMRKLISTLTIFSALSICAFSQESAPRVSVFGGHSYMNVDTNGLSSRQSLNGFDVAPSFDVNRLFAVEGDFGGYYKGSLASIGDVHVGTAHAYTFMGGPRLNFGPLFVHGLVGGDRVSAGALGVSVVQSAFAGAFGGGFQSRPFAKHFAVRASADYFLTDHESTIQNNIRVSTGLVYKFGH